MELDAKLIEDITKWAKGFVPKLLLAIAIIIIGFWLIKKVLKLINISLDKANMGQEIKGFFISLIEIILKFVVLLIAAGVIGFETSSLIGVLAAAGFAIGLALQGFMGNFASGITIVFFKPYKIGDWVEISEKFGRVTDIHIFNTTLQTPGKKTLIIPNGQVTDNIITNFSTQGYIRLKLRVTMPYAESFPRVKGIIEHAIKDAPGILDHPKPEIGILEYESHSIVVGVRPYIHPDNFWDVTYDVNERIKAAFHKSDVQVAYSEGVELGPIGA